MLPTATLQARRAIQVEAQEAVNATYATQGIEAAAQQIRNLARAENAGYAQYDGYWDGPEWLVAQAGYDIKSKGGDQALAGDLVLMRKRSGGGYTFYSVRLGWNCGGSYGPEPVVGWSKALRDWQALEDQRRAQSHAAYVEALMASMAAERELEGQVS